MNLFLAGGVLLAGRDVGGCVGGRAGSCGGGGCGCPVQLADSVVRSLVLDDLERMQRRPIRTSGDQATAFLLPRHKFAGIFESGRGDERIPRV